MADVIRRILQRKVDAFDDELIRAGFTIGEIEALRDRAMQEVARPVPSTGPRSREDTILDMAAVISLAAEEGMDGTVTRADLHRAGFTDAEIDACRAAAVAEAQRRLARPVETAA